MEVIGQLHVPGALSTAPMELDTGCATESVWDPPKEVKVSCFSWESKHEFSASQYFA